MMKIIGTKREAKKWVYVSCRPAHTVKTKNIAVREECQREIRWRACEDSNLRHWIRSLERLEEIGGASERDRTSDLLITNQLA